MSQEQNTAKAVMTVEQMQAEIARLQQENAKLSKPKTETTKVGETKLSLAIGKSGAVCVYGLSRFPVSLYPSQWQRLLHIGTAILEYSEANKAKIDSIIASKPPKAVKSK